MTLRALVAAAGLIAASLAPAFAADSFTATVKSWDPAKRLLVFTDRTQLQSIPTTVEVPADVAPGEELRVTYRASENGVDAVLAVTRTGRRG